MAMILRLSRRLYINRPRAQPKTTYSLIWPQLPRSRRLKRRQSANNQKRRSPTLVQRGPGRQRALKTLYRSKKSPSRKPERMVMEMANSCAEMASISCHLPKQLAKNALSGGLLPLDIPCILKSYNQAFHSQCATVQV